MLLLHVSVQGWVRQVSLVAILAFEISALVVVFASSFAADSGAVFVIVVAIVRATVHGV